MSIIGKFVKGTVAVTKVVSTAMGGFDTIALLDKAFGNGDIAALNAKLHSSKLYNFAQIGISAVAAFTGGMATTMSCFVAGTMVMTATGLMAIENIKVGYKVLSEDSDTFVREYKRVEKAFSRQVNHIIHLTINGEEIITTPNHPFYVYRKGFVDASKLWINAELVDKTGNILHIDQIFRENFDKDFIAVYNIKVEEYHTYFVGKNCIWVHNADCTIEFNNKSGLDEKEYKQQLADQQDGLNNMTVEEYQNNRASYETNGRASDSSKFQQSARQEAIADRTTQNIQKGMSYEDACNEAASWAKGKVALHGPDQIAGGGPENITGLGDSKINSSIGSQWKADSRIGTLDAYVDKFASGLSPAERSTTHLNVELVLNSNS